jgi:peptidyl-prolyl cis-trans isomerase C
MSFRTVAAAVLVLSAAGGCGLAQAWATEPAPASMPQPQIAPTPTGLPPGNTVVARVNGVELRLSDVEAARQALPADAKRMPFSQIYPMLLDRMIDSMLVTEAGRQQHLDQTPEFQRRLKLVEDRLIQQAYLEEIIKNAQGDNQLKAAYQKYLQQKPPREEVHARQILVRTEAQAQSIIEQLNKGADFAGLAKKYSSDPTAASGGDLGYFTRDDMVPGFAAVAFALQPGQYTKTPVKTEFGWHVILVVDRRAKQPSFDEARAELGNLLAREAVEAAVKQLRQQAKVEAFGLDGKPLAAEK